MQFLISCLFLFMFSASVEAQPSSIAGAKCSKFEASDRGQKIKGRFCIYGANRAANPDILYFFHGVSGDETNWGNPEYSEYEQMRKRWKQKRVPLPTVISVSFGPNWILTAPWKSSPGLHRLLTEKIMPRLETELGGLGRGRRFVLGTSMGGFNAATLYLQDPKLFSKFALACPAIATISPYATKFELLAYTHRTGANPAYVYHFMGIAENLIRDENAWPLNDVLGIAERILGPPRPPIYISCGQDDELGFFEGASYFAQMIKESGSTIYWQPLKGGHCVMNSNSVADFFYGVPQKAH